MNDFRFALRRLCKSPGYSLTAVATLALGIGANTAIFSVVTSVLLAPLPFPESERLVRIVVTPPQASGQVLQTSPAACDDALRHLTYDHVDNFVGLPSVLA